ncbi:hypothetical protein [Streptomyces sp. NPDC047453]|uniref:hypothetical protein n=1 Tax=Streptomyces sp. NPDC047453 TaxID=3154812 RepID=UPI0033EB1491
MTDEVGVITGELTIATRLLPDGRAGIKKVPLALVMTAAALGSVAVDGLAGKTSAASADHTAAKFRMDGHNRRVSAVKRS